MNKQTKELLTKNNKRELLLADENKETYTNMIAYIRNAPLTEYDIELVRSDLVEIVLDAQLRGENITQVFNGRYKEVCDNIIAALPEKTLQEKLIFYADIALKSTSVLGLIALITNVIDDLQAQAGFQTFSLTNGQLLSTLFILLSSYGLVHYISKTALKEEPETIKEVIFVATILFIILLPTLFMHTIVIETSYTIAILCILLLFGASKIIATKVK